ncbi:MAG: response regulator [Dehalococcoidia bacterium]
MPENLKVLVVDDNVEFCQNVADILEMRDYKVKIAYDGLNAIEMVKEDGFNLVLMDFKMPVIDGVETFKRLKEIAPETAVIFITAYATENIIDDALRQGAFGCLKKPLDFERLFAVIENTIADGALVLVVDDDQDLCANMEAILSDRGFRVSVALDGRIALEKIRENNFDIILLDMKLPYHNGLEIYLAARALRPDMTAIITTGYPQEMGGMAQQALKKCAYTYLEKPVNIDELTQLLEQIAEDKGRGTLKKPQ